MKFGIIIGGELSFGLLVQDIMLFGSMLVALFIVLWLLGIKVMQRLYIIVKLGLMAGLGILLINLMDQQMPLTTLFIVLVCLIIWRKAGVVVMMELIIAIVLFISIAITVKRVAGHNNFIKFCYRSDFTIIGMLGILLGLLVGLEFGLRNEISLLLAFRSICNSGNHCFMGMGVLGNQLMVCAFEGAIDIYSSELEYVKQITFNGRHFGIFSGITYDENYNAFYGSDYDNNKIEVFNSDGVVLRSFGYNGVGSKHNLKGPIGICVADRYVFVANSGKHNIAIFTIEGEYVTSFGKRG